MGHRRTYIDDCFDEINAEEPTEEMKAIQAEIERLTAMYAKLQQQQQYAGFKRVAKIIHEKGKRCERRFLLAP